MDFEKYLEKVFVSDNPEVLDDDLSEAFDYWLVDLEIDDFIKYAEEWCEKEIDAVNKD